MKKSSVLIIAVAAALMFAAASVLYNRFGGSDAADAALRPRETSASSAVSEAVSAAAQEQPDGFSGRDFKMYDAEGNSVSLSDFEGRPAVLNFWASWCGPCKMEMPELEAAYAEYGDRISFLAVNLSEGFGDTLAKASKLISDAGYTFPVYYDNDGEGARAYRIRSIPMTFFLDEHGNIAAKHLGSMTETVLSNGISLLLEEK